MQDYKPKSIILMQGVIKPDVLRKVKLGSGTSAFICEGRPSLEAAKLNSAALIAQKVIPTVISDNMPGFLFFKGLVKEVHIACQYADKTGALCDTGALICAVLAKKHKVPVKLVEGKLKTRFLGNPKDILSFEGVQVAPKGTHAYVPLVEWVPNKYLR